MKIHKYNKNNRLVNISYCKSLKNIFYVNHVEKKFTLKYLIHLFMSILCALKLKFSNKQQVCHNMYAILLFKVLTIRYV